MILNVVNFTLLTLWKKRIKNKESVVHEIYWGGFESGQGCERARLYRLIDDYKSKMEPHSLVWAVLNSLKYEDIDDS